jgi:hypothetical protein
MNKYFVIFKIILGDKNFYNKSIQFNIYNAKSKEEARQQLIEEWKDFSGKLIINYVIELEYIIKHKEGYIGNVWCSDSIDDHALESKKKVFII